jgi:ADP-ribose pyrophosphatase
MTKTKEIVKYQGKFASFCEKNTWEYIKRKNNQKIVTIIPIDCINNEIIFIKQWREAVGKYVVEFPAGLIDKNEVPIQAAKRELMEETGYEGEVIFASPLLSKSAGITNECGYIIKINVTFKGDQNLQDNEKIEVLKCPIIGRFRWLKHLEKEENTIIDGQVYLYLLNFAGEL